MEKTAITCFVIMPYGLCDEYPKGSAESDFVYSEIIKKAIESASTILGYDIKCIRVADKSLPGAIDSSIIRNLANSDIVIVDITGKNPDIYLMLGIRYALRKKSTILLGQTETSIPFDINFYRYLSYNPFKPSEASTQLAEIIVKAQDEIADSPIYDVLPDLEVYLRGPIRPDIYSCFISYSDEDKAFAQKLFADLQRNGVSCWYAPENIKGGERIHDQINEGILRHDKTLLILSENSMKSNWVAEEIRRTRSREHLEGRKKLFPVRIASFDTIKKWELFDSDEARDLAAVVREYYVVDFSNWTDPNAYNKSLDRLLWDLKAVM